jgi:hypothetical protein
LSHRQIPRIGDRLRGCTKFGNPAACFLQGQAYLADASIGRELGDSEQVKVVCAPTEMVDASIPMLQSNSAPETRGAGQ